MATAPAMMKTKAQGFTLTELAIVLGVIGVILGAIWVAASMVQSNQKAEKMSQEIATIVANMRSSWPNGHFDPGAQWFGALAVNNNIIPMLASCATPGFNWPSYKGAGNMCGITPYGVQIIVGTQTGVAGSTASINAFEIELGSLTAAQCQSWLPGFVQTARANGLVYAATGDGSEAAINATTPITQFQNCSGTVVLQFNL